MHLTRAAASFLLFALALLPATCAAQTGAVKTPDYGLGQKWFPHVLAPYKQSSIAPANLDNSQGLSQMVHDGKIELSLTQLAQLVVENNLTLAADRYNYGFAKTDLLRSQGGQAARGVAAAGANIPDAFFTAAIGSGVGNLAGLGGIGLNGAITETTRTIVLTPRGAYDPTLIFNASWDRTASPLNTLVVAGIPDVLTNTAFYQLGWEQAFTTGTSFSVAFTNQRQGSTQNSLLFQPNVISRITIGVVQQLTNGFGRTVNRRFITASHNDISIVRNWFEQQVDTTLAQAEDAYWNLVLAQEQVESSQQAVKAAMDLLADSQVRATIGVMDPLDVLTAESGVAAARRDLIVAQTNLDQQQLSLKTLFAKQITESLGDVRIVATEPLPQPKPSDVPDLNDALHTAMMNRPELPQAQGAADNDKLALKLTRNLLLPTFNVYGYFAPGGLAGDSYANLSGTRVLEQAGLPQALAEVFEGKFPEYAYGFTLTIPLRNRQAIADNIRATIDEQQDDVAYKRTANQITVQVRNAISTLVQARDQVEAAEQATDYSRQNAAAEQTKLNLGASTPYNVILAQNAVLNAELAELQTRVAYANALVVMDVSTGTILGKVHIDIDQALAGRLSRNVPSTEIRDEP